MGVYLNVNAYYGVLFPCGGGSLHAASLMEMLFNEDALELFEEEEPESLGELSAWSDEAADCLERFGMDGIFLGDEGEGVDLVLYLKEPEEVVSESLPTEEYFTPRLMTPPAGSDKVEEFLKEKELVASPGWILHARQSY